MARVTLGGRQEGSGWAEYGEGGLTIAAKGSLGKRAAWAAAQLQPAACRLPGFNSFVAELVAKTKKKT